MKIWQKKAKRKKNFKDIPHLRKINVNKGNPFKNLENSEKKKIKILILDLSRNGFSPIDIQYLTDIDLKNLRI